MIYYVVVELTCCHTLRRYKMIIIHPLEGRISLVLVVVAVIVLSDMFGFGVVLSHLGAIVVPICFGIFVHTVIVCFRNKAHKDPAEGE